MPTIIETKLHPPRLPLGYVTRPRLLTLLDEGLARGLILVTAPAGYGKTSLVVDWLQQRPTLRVAWFSLAETDNDLDLFLRYLTTAVQRAFPDTRTRPCLPTQALLDAPHPPPLDTISHTLSNDLAHLPHPLLLILDDYHLLTLPAIQQVIATLCRYLPPNLQLLLTSRVLPALPQLARLRAQQRVLEIQAADLRVVLPEAQAILKQTVGTELDEATTALLDAQTEGWVIGLQLAGLSLRGQPDPAAFARTLELRNQELVTELLLTEVLAHEPPEILTFLYHTAVLERLCDSLCQAVIPPSASTTPLPRLAQLAQSGLFIIALDTQGKWYRYHHLFQSLLQQRLAQEWAETEIAAVHRRAAGWLAEQGFIEEALQNLLAGGDVDTAVVLIETERHNILNQGEIHRLARWLNLLPPQTINQHASLLQLQAWVLRWQANFAAIPPLLQQAEALLQQAHTATTTTHPSIAPDILQAERDVLRGEIAFFQNNFAPSIAYTQSALDRLPSSYTFMRGVAVLFHLLSQQTMGQTTQALAQLHRWLADEQFQHPISRHFLLIAAGAIYSTNGDLKRLEPIGQVLLKLGLEHEKPLSISWGHYFLALVYYQWNRLEEAYTHWSGVCAWRYQANFRLYHEAMLGIALLHYCQGEDAQAEQTLATLTQVLLELNQGQFAPEVESFRARLALMRGEVDTAVSWLPTSPPPTRMPVNFWETNDLTRIKLLLAQDTPTSRQQAATLLNTTQQYATNTDSLWLRIQIQALRALLAQANNDTTQALTAAAQAIHLAEPGGYLRLFVELGSPMAHLLTQLAQQGTAPTYITQILQAFPVAPPTPTELTLREQEILALLHQGFSDKEIAQQLVLSILTVKKHNRHIYQKLGVPNRRQAVAKAKKLHLLP
jgi:LuxR family transcriptional regulator, maltose regulon positive regulatory protein